MFQHSQEQYVHYGSKMLLKSTGATSTTTELDVDNNEGRNFRAHPPAKSSFKGSGGGVSFLLQVCIHLPSPPQEKEKALWPGKAEREGSAEISSYLVVSKMCYFCRI